MADFDYIPILMRDVAANLMDDLRFAHGDKRPAILVDRNTSTSAELRRAARDVRAWIRREGIYHGKWSYKTALLWCRLSMWALGEDPGIPHISKKKRLKGEKERRGEDGPRPGPAKSRAFSQEGQMSALLPPPPQSAGAANVPRNVRGNSRGRAGAAPAPPRRAT